MLLAGLYDRAQLEGESEPLWTFTIVTTDANKDFQWLHDRQPVILPSMEALTQWLDTTPQKWTSELNKIVEPYHDAEAPLACYRVPKEVGKVGMESPAFIHPIAGRKDGIQAMFAKQAASTSSQPTKATKRKRSTSPPQHFLSTNETKSEPSMDAKPSADKLNTWEDDSAIEYVDGPSSTPDKKSKVKQEADDKHTPPSTPSKRARTTAKSPKVATPRKQQGKPTDSSSKITAFFGKT